MAEDIDTSLCTHFIYAFAVLDGENHVMKAHDAWLDLDRSGGFRGWNKGLFRKFTDLKKKNPNAKYLVRPKTLARKYDLFMIFSFSWRWEDGTTPLKGNILSCWPTPPR